ncbi:MAG: catalase [Gammaproteobacteria bacterium]|nr:catalase [Gammaproteobacteria bacterium]
MMLVVSPTPFSIPLNTAHVPTETVETQNKFSERIPESERTFELPNSKGAEVGQELNESDRAEQNSEQSTDQPDSEQIQSADPSSNQTLREENQQQREEQAIIRNLASIDRRVKAHEQAHASVGGVYAGSASFTYKTGPDGVRYAVGGEVPIDTSAVPGDPQATLRKAEQVARAALAPADPSSTDRRIASSAQAMASKARFEIAQLAAEKIQSNREDTQARINGEDVDDSDSPELSTSFSGGQLHAALQTDATEQVGGQVSTSA